MSKPKPATTYGFLDSKCKRCGENRNEWGEPLNKNESSGVHTCTPSVEWLESEEGKLELIKSESYRKGYDEGFLKGLEEFSQLVSNRQNKKIKIPFEWEILESSKKVNSNSVFYQTCRTKVIGGWILNIINQKSQSSVFIPDPNHEWEI